MPHKTREEAEEQARENGIDISQVVKTDVGYFIAPQGIKSSIAKEIYGKNRARGKNKETAAKIAWSVENKVNRGGNARRRYPKNYRKK